MQISEVNSQLVMNLGLVVPNTDSSTSMCYSQKLTVNLVLTVLAVATECALAA